MRTGSIALALLASVPAIARAQGTQAVSVAATTLNVRDGAWGTVVGSAPQGSAWVLTGGTDQGFVEISFRGSKAWIYASYTTPYSGQGARVDAPTLDVLDGPGSGASVVGAVHAGQSYVAVSASGSSVELRYDESLRWV